MLVNTQRVTRSMSRPLLVAFGLTAMLAMGAAQAQTTTANGTAPQDAEHRIVWNKANGLPKYEGVSITYNYRLVSEGTWSSASELEQAIAGRFSGVSASGFRREGDAIVLFITTDGDAANHTVYNTALEEHLGVLARMPRQYHTH